MIRWSNLIILWVFLWSGARQAEAASLTLYTDSLGAGVIDQSWAVHTLQQQNQVHSGSLAASFEPDKWRAFYLRTNSGFDLTRTPILRFWIHGGSQGGQRLLVGFLNQNRPVTTVPLERYNNNAPLRANQWSKVEIDTQPLGLTNIISGIWIQDPSGVAQPTVYLDDLALLSADELTPAPPTSTPPPSSTDTPALMVPVYLDAVGSNFQDWSWASRNMTQSQIVHNGTSAISFEPDGWRALYFHAKAPITNNNLTSLKLWLNGGASGGQKLTLVFALGTRSLASVDIEGSLPGGVIASNQWQELAVSLSSIGLLQNGTMRAWDGFWLQDDTGRDQPAVYVDDVALYGNGGISTPNPTPAPTPTPTPSVPGGSSGGSSTPTEIPGPGGILIVEADHPNVQYVGRFDFSDAKRPKAAWEGAQIAIRFNGTGANVRLREMNRANHVDYFNVMVDNQAPRVLALARDVTVYSLVSNLPSGEHVIRLFKRTEADVGTVEFFGFELLGSSGSLAQPPHKLRHIEFVGDSITAGYGNEGANAYCPFSAATENNYLAYGAVTARALDAEYHAVAWSGKGIYRNRNISDPLTMPILYQRTLPAVDNSRWDYDSWEPDVIVINLGTNDFAQTNPPQGPYTAAYDAFIDDLRSHYPDVYIILAIGPMFSDYYPAGLRQVTTVRRYTSELVAARQAVGDDHIAMIEFPSQDTSSNIGCDYHPSVRTHQSMADQLIPLVRSVTGW